MKVELTGDWKKSKRVLRSAPQDIDKAIQAGLAGEGEFLRGQMVRRMRGGLMPPHSSSTLLTKKKGTKPLIRNGDLLGSFSSVPSRRQVFIGIPRTARGESLNLMQLFEKGKVIVQRMTDKQRKFLHATLPNVGHPAGPPVIVIHIPARPVIQPVYDQQAPLIPARLAGRITRALAKTQLGSVTKPMTGKK